MTSIGDYNKIMSDRKLFNKVVYTPLSEALKILEERKKDKKLIAKVEKLLKGDIPEVLKRKKYCVQFRQIATPNNDCRHFIRLAKGNNLHPVFFEYFDDKFTSNNEFKHSLGQLRVQGKVNKKDNYPIEKITIVDFTKHDGKKLKDVKTLWGEKLIDFHRRLFLVHDYYFDNSNFYDASVWLKNNGGKAIDYYTNFFLLFICNGILFENFLTTNDEEGEFTKNIVLPAIEKVIKLTGVKPLIIPIGALDMENDTHWISYHPKVKILIPKI
ncbi:MAG: hypothetical protein WC662_01305 [Candidatus Paceibacterota bacterium]|jgi:hypothetical protein